MQNPHPRGGGGGGGGAFIWRGLFSEFYGKLKVNKKTEAQMHTKKREKRKKRYYYAMKEA